MFVKMYRYRIRPDREKQYLAIHDRAAQIYRKHVRFREVHLKSPGDPGTWVELQYYEDEQTYLNTIKVIEAEPEIGELFQKFQDVIDPAHTGVKEEQFELARVYDYLADEDKDS